MHQFLRYVVQIPQLSSSDATWIRFLDCCRQTTRLHLTPYGGPPIHNSRFFASMPSENTVVFPNLRVARMHFDLLRSPFIAPSLVDLTILLAPFGYIGVVKMLSPKDARAAAAVLSGLETLRVEGDCQRSLSRRELMDFIRHLTNLKTLILDPPALSPPMFRLAATLPHLERIAVRECSHHGMGKATFHNEHGALWSPVGSYGPACYNKLRHFAFQTTRTVHVGRIILQDPFPFRTLLTLWIKFVDNPIILRSHVRHLLQDLVSTCQALEGLTLRFCGRADAEGRPNQTETRPLSWDDIAVFLLFPRLTHFAIDDTVPLDIDMANIVWLSLHGGRFRKLWLNPYPLRGGGSALKGSGLGLDALVCLAKSCQSLESLGMLLVVDDDIHSRYDDAGISKVTRFPCLTEFSVGWSYVAESILSRSSRVHADVLSRLFRSDTRLLTCSEYNWEVAGEWLNSDMRAMPDILGYSASMSSNLSLDWKALWALAMFFRECRERKGFAHLGPGTISS